MKTIGLTGGIGAGKSTVTEMLRKSGLAVVDTDDLAREVVAPGEPALEEIRQVFGAQFIGPNDGLRREELGRLVFRDNEARQRLEGILHPRIQERWEAQVAEWRASGRVQGVVVIPLLFEKGYSQEFTMTVCVSCSSSTQCQRLRQRGWSGEEVKRRLAAQLSMAVKMERADRVLWNDAGLGVLDAQVKRVFS